MQVTISEALELVSKVGLGNMNEQTKNRFEADKRNGFLGGARIVRKNANLVIQGANIHYWIPLPQNVFNEFIDA